MSALVPVFLFGKFAYTPQKPKNLVRTYYYTLSFLLNMICIIPVRRISVQWIYNSKDKSIKVATNNTLSYQFIL